MNHNLEIPRYIPFVSLFEQSSINESPVRLCTTNDVSRESSGTEYLAVVTLMIIRIICVLTFLFLFKQIIHLIEIPIF